MSLNRNKSLHYFHSFPNINTLFIKFFKYDLEKKNTDLEKINISLSNTMSDYLDIKIINIGDNFITASMPVNKKTIQPFGILHGGASVVLAETLGSVASNLCLKITTPWV